MKHLLGIIFFIFSIHSVTAQDKFHRISINVALSHPVLKKNYFPDYRYRLDKEIEVLLNFKIYKSSVLSGGIGLEYAEHFRIEEINKLIWVEGSGYLPTEYTHNWNLNYKSIQFPVYFETPINNFILDFFVLSTKIGWIWNYDLSEHAVPDVSHIKINRHYVDLSCGVGETFLQFENVSLGLVPIIGSRIYLGNNNNWQNSYFFYQIRFNVNF